MTNDNRGPSEKAMANHNVRLVETMTCDNGDWGSTKDDCGWCPMTLEDCQLWLQVVG